MAGLAAACGSDLSLEGRPCPCADGWVCCKTEGTCIRPGSACVDSGPVHIEPASAKLRLRGSQQFVTTNSVSWSVDEAGGGSIDAQGLYRAPMTPGKYHVRATTGTGASATATVVVGPTELVRVLGFPGGAGSADGFGTNARFGRPGSIVADAQYLYVIDEPAPEPALDPGSEPARPADGPMGVRKINRATTEVTWLAESFYPLRGLAFAESTLFAGQRESKSIGSAVRMISTVHPAGIGASIGAPLGEKPVVPRDGPYAVEWGPSGDAPLQAILGNVSGLTSGWGRLYFTDTDPDCLYTALRQVDLWKRKVTTLAAAPGWPGETWGKTFATAPFRCLDAVAFHEGKIYAADRGDTELGDGTKRQKIWVYDTETAAIDHFWTGYRPVSSDLVAFCFDGADDAIGISGNSSGSCVGWAFNEQLSCSGGQRAALGGSPGGLLCAGKWLEDDGSGAGLSPGLGHGEGSFYASIALGVAEIDRSSAVPGWGGSKVTVLAGTAEYDGPTGPGPEMRLEHPSGVSADAAGNLVVFEGGKRFLRLDSSGEVTALPCGPTAAGGYRNLSASSPAGDLYFMDGGALKKLDPATGECAALASIDAPPSTATIRIDLAHDGLGKLYLSSFHDSSRRVTRIDAASGASDTLLDGRSGFLATDGEKRLFVADLGDARQRCARTILEVDLADLESHALPRPEGGWCATALAYDPVGVLYVAEATRHRVRALAVETGEVVDLVGVQGHEAVLPGPLPASLNRPIDIALLPDGALAIADLDEHVVLLAR